MEDNKPDTPVTLKIDPSFMDTWTPLPDNTHSSITTHTGKITTHRERRQQRIQLSTSAYKSYTIQHRAGNLSNEIDVRWSIERPE